LIHSFLELILRNEKLEIVLFKKIIITTKCNLRLGLSLLSSLWVSHAGSASDWCALQEALYKCIDTIQYCYDYNNYGWREHS